MREGNLDTRSVEVHLDQAVVSAPYAPLIAGSSLDDDPDGDPVIAKSSDTGHIEGGEQLVTVLGVFLERFVGELELLNGFVDILAIGDVVFAQMIAELTHVVGDGVHAGEGHHMVGTGKITNAHRADAEAFGSAGNTTNGDDIACVHGVFHLNEDTGNDVLHQLLRTKTDGQAQYPGTGDQRTDIDADLGQHDHHGHGQQGDGQRISKQRQQGLGASRGYRVVGAGIELMLDQAGQCQPYSDGQQQNHRHAEQGADNGTSAFGGVPGGQVESAPGIQHQQHYADQDQCTDDTQGIGYVAVEAWLKQRQFLS